MSRGPAIDDDPAARAPAPSADVRVEGLTAGWEPAWDDYVRAAPRGTAFHLLGWKRVVERTFGHRAVYLLARRG